MKQSMMMITDYSSVFFDMIYMKKPIIFYQFDYEKFRLAQYSEGYFNYKDNPFGKSCPTKEDVFLELETCIENQFRPSESFLNAHKKYFKLFDSNNCKRVFSIVKKL
jgi:CDP-glycerol glycerophosphotransferase (TagB/SpsB family)